MISIEDLKRIAKLKGLNNLGNAEKDYLIDIVLLSISRNTKDELVFKGGTCLYRFYKLDRFSEDVDFTLKKELDTDNLIKKIIADLISFGVDAEIKSEKKILDSVMTTIRSKGPLYRGTPQSLSNIRIDINLKSSIDIEPEIAKYSSLYPDIPTFSLVIMQETEILAEKIRAIITRTKSRDMYDLWFLLRKNVAVDLPLINKKLSYYGTVFNVKEFKEKLEETRKTWETDLKQIVTFVPNFENTINEILAKFSDLQ